MATGNTNPRTAPCVSLTLTEVEANDFLAQQVRHQARRILEDLARDGEVRWVGAGYHRHHAPVRDFAFRVLLAKGIIARTDDPRRFVVTA